MRIHDVFHVSLLKPYYNDGCALDVHRLHCKIRLECTVKRE